MSILAILTPCIAVSKLVYFAICGLVLLIPKECFKTKKRKVLFVSIIAGVITALYLEWTSATKIGGTEITGVQGRYFTPIALLMTVLIPIKYIETKRKLDAKWIYIITTLCQVPSLLNMFIHYI
ncbi:MAG TPA: hypothetical protein DER15_03465 [Clostridiales bacterium]|nr:hypothetical protein [Clostridiales bacterium]